jgi:hypothetical protein
MTAMVKVSPNAVEYAEQIRRVIAQKQDAFKNFFKKSPPFSSQTPDYTTRPVVPDILPKSRPNCNVKCVCLSAVAKFTRHNVNEGGRRPLRLVLRSGAQSPCRFPKGKFMGAKTPASIFEKQNCRGRDYRRFYEAKHRGIRSKTAWGDWRKV